MLRKFLNLFKHDDAQAQGELEGSYLDYLLSHVEEGVSQELQVCQTHDPLLLVITTTLRVAMPGAWSDLITRPIVDPNQVAMVRSTPPPPPASSKIPPPPPPGASMEEDPQRADDTKELPVDELLIEEAIAEDVETVEEQRPRTEELDIDAELLDEDSDLIEEISTPQRSVAHDATGEFKPLKSAPAPSEDDEDDLPRLDNREVLQAGRVFLGMLIENDRLPLELQLGLEELGLSRDLLMGQHLGEKNLEQKAQQLLRIVERKFSEGQFSQARILLQLFQTDRATRVRNDRNIFYEDMIQRLGIRRRHPVADDLLEEYKQLELSDEPLESLSTWLDHKIFIKFHLFCRRTQEVERWTALADQFEQPGGKDLLLRYLPPKRWRPFFNQLQEDGQPLKNSAARHEGGDLVSLVSRHIHSDTLSTYVVNHIRTCYFVLRAVGDTGLEKYLDTFFNWTESSLNYNATLFLPELYRRSMGETDLMRTIFVDLYSRHLRGAAEAWLEKLTEQDIRDAMEKASKTLQGCNLNDVPPGNYDLGGFIFDALFDVTYPTPEFAFKVHRLT